MKSLQKIYVTVFFFPLTLLILLFSMTENTNLNLTACWPPLHMRMVLRWYGTNYFCPLKTQINTTVILYHHAQTIIMEICILSNVSNRQGDPKGVYKMMVCKRFSIWTLGVGSWSPSLQRAIGNQMQSVSTKSISELLRCIKSGIYALRLLNAAQW